MRRVERIRSRHFRISDNKEYYNSTYCFGDPNRFLFGRSEWYTLVFVNGHFAPELSNAESLPAGVRLLDLRRAWREAPELTAQLGQITV